MTVSAVAVLIVLVAPLSTLAASGAEWSRLSERTRQQVYHMEASVNHVPADPGGRQKAYEAYMATFSPQVRVHGLVPGDTDYGGVRRFYAALFGTMRGSVLVSDELIVAGSMAAQRYHAVGRMSGEFDGARLENRLVALRGQTFFHLGDDGRIIERWSNHDHGYRMSQTLGPEGRAKGDQLAHELNGTGLAETAVYERLAALARAASIVEDPSRREREFVALFDPSVVVHGVGRDPGTLDGLIDDMHALWKAFPDLVLNHEAQLSAWSMGAVRWRATGSRRAPWEGAPADWQPVLLTGEMILRYGSDGRIVELWTYRHKVQALETRLAD